MADYRTSAEDTIGHSAGYWRKQATSAALEMVQMRELIQAQRIEIEKLKAQIERLTAQDKETK